MPNELVAIPSAYAASFAWVDDETYARANVYRLLDNAIVRLT